MEPMVGAGQVKITYTINAGVVSGTNSFALERLPTYRPIKLEALGPLVNTAVATVNSSTGV